MMQWSIDIAIEFILWILDQFIVIFNFVLLSTEAYKKYKSGIPAAYDTGLAIFFIINLVAYSWLTMRLFFYDLWGLTAYIEISRVISQILTMISLIVVTLGIERTIIKRTKYVLSILMSIYVLSIIIMYSFGFQISIFAFPFNVINFGLVMILPILYAYIAIKYPGKIRKNALTMFVGLMLMFIGAIFNYENAQSIVPDLLVNPMLALYIRFTSISFIIIGILILTYGFIKFGKEE